MARKYIITDDQFIMGNVKYHFELKPERSKAHPEGGGFWHIDPQKKIFYLYGVSSDFGGIMRERLKEVLSTTLLNPNLNGYEIHHSYSLQFPDATDWEHIHTIDLAALAGVGGTPDATDAQGNFMDMKTSGALPRRRSTKAVPVRVEKKVGRNEPCPCGSGKKYKKCCL